MLCVRLTLWRQADIRASYPRGNAMQQWKYHRWYQSVWGSLEHRKRCSSCILDRIVMRFHLAFIHCHLVQSWFKDDGLVATIVVCNRIRNLFVWVMYDHDRSVCPVRFTNSYYAINVVSLAKMFPAALLLLPLVSNKEGGEKNAKPIVIAFYFIWW